ncbi:tetratricopeptide repeat protein [Candidatus Daviesbacteria bacterium]|nr:tetratricopeptide repeat protein [Candidatus Daviesbacteria bacterium]
MMSEISSLAEKITVRKAVFIIFLVGFLVYFNALFNGFVWDDEEQIVKNTVIQSLTNFPQILSGATFNSGGAGLSGWFFRPLFTFNYMFLYAIWGPNPFGFHLFQVIFHLLNGVLVFKILSQLLKRSKYSLLIAAIFATIYVVHAALNLAVVYIAALSEVTLTFFNLSAFYLMIKTLPQKPGIYRLSFWGLLLFCGMLIKESSIVMLPIIITYLLIERFSNWRRWAIAAGVVFIFYFIVRLMVIQTPIRPLELSLISEASLPQRLMTIPWELSVYLGNFFYPARLAIAQHFVVKTFDIYNFWLPITFDLLMIVTGLVIAYKARSKLILFGLLWFGLGFGLVSNIFPLDMTIGEAWMYFPYIGLIFAVAGTFDWLIKNRPKLLPISIIFFSLAIGALGIRTIIRNSNFYDNLTLFAHDVSISPNSFDTENNLGVALFRQGDTQGAKVHFLKSLAIQPKWYFALNNLGAVYEREGNWPEAKKLYEQVTLETDYYLSFENLAMIYLNHESTASAQEFASKTLKKLPQNPRLWIVLAIADYNLGQTDKALQDAQNSYAISPSTEALRLISLIKANQPIPTGD